MRRPKRALLITSSFPRWQGDSTTPFVLNLACDLQDQGWEIEVIAPHAPGALLHEALDGVSVRRFRYLLPESQQTVCYGGGALINLRESRMNWVKVPLLVTAELLVVLRMLIRRRFAVVNAHWILPQGFVGAIAGWLTRTPLVITVHGGDVFDLQSPLLGRFKRWALRRAAAVTANSSVTEAATAAIGATARIVRIPMGIDVQEPEASRAESIRTTYKRGAGPLITFAGRLVEEKGAGDLIHALALLKSVLPDATLLIIGTGQDEGRFVTLAEDLGVTDAVHFVGWVAPQEVSAYMAAADVFAGPSKRSRGGWQEGLGLVFLEAMAAGTPVIATRSGGIIDVVEHERSGLLVPEGDPEELAAVIARLHDDDELARQLESNGREVMAQYSRQGSAAGFAELFESVRR